MTGRRWIALLALVVIGVGLLVTVVVPWRDDTPGSNAAPTVYHQGDPIAVPNGAEFVIALPANPSTGYSWTAGDDHDITFVSSRQLAGGNQPGAAGTQELTFRATNIGTTTLVLAYARPFESGVPPVKTAQFPVTVRR
ncbi:MAG: inhibitor of cysteine peptidase [Actinomycetota bacterium]|nr:inhibitor of cysteine peptidase [Actinomycetota bacterium]